MTAQYHVMTRAHRGLLLAITSTLALSSLPATADIELFLSDYGEDQITRFDGQTGAFLGVFCNHSAIDRAVNLEWGPDGNLYVANFGPGNILKIDGQTGQYLGEFASYSWLEECVELIFHGDYLYVLGNDHHNVVMFDAKTGGFVREFGSPAIRYPHDFVFGPDGLLYITTENNNQGLVQVWDVSTFTMVGYFGAGADLELATGITFGPDKNIYVCNWWNSKILRYDSSSLQLIDVFVTQQSGGMSGPSNITFRPDGYLYVSNSNGVHRYDARTGAFVDVFIPKGLGGLDRARGFVFRSPLGDINCDGELDFGDINPFVMALTDPGAYWSAYPDCPLANRDINGDGVLDFQDINPFVDLLTAP